MITATAQHRPGLRAAGRVAVIVALGTLALVFASGTAAAHPLGNFSVNHAVALRVQPDWVFVDLVVDLAEIPSVAAYRQLDADRDGRVTDPERQAYGGGRCTGYASQLHLDLDTVRTPLLVLTTTVFVEPGVSALPTVRLDCRLVSAPESTVGHRLRFSDDSDGGHVGWREVTALGEGVGVADSTVPTVSPSAALTRYPPDRLSRPMDQRSAELKVVAAPRGAGQARSSGGSVLGVRAPAVTDRLAQLARERGGLPGALALLVAFGLGAAHAVGPGHGKTVMAAYLVGQRGSLRQAVVMGLSVTLTHTAGVLVLAVLAGLSVVAAPERAYPWLGLLDGLLLVGVGMGLLRAIRRPRSTTRGGGERPADHDTAKQHGGVDGDGDGRDLPYEHGHRHPHQHPHPHRHGWSVGSLLTLGFAGGMVPTPSAVLLLLGAAALGRPVFGVLLVLAYGAGMAVSLLAAGVVLATGRRRLARRLAASSHGGPLALRTLARALPVVTPWVIIVVGLFLSGRGVDQLIG